MVVRNSSYKVRKEKSPKFVRKTGKNPENLSPTFCFRRTGHPRKYYSGLSFILFVLDVLLFAVRGEAAEVNQRILHGPRPRRGIKK